MFRTLGIDVDAFAVAARLAACARFVFSAHTNVRAIFFELSAIVGMRLGAVRIAGRERIRIEPIGDAVAIVVGTF